MSTALDSPISKVIKASGRPLRVLLVTQASGGGVGRHFLDLAQALTAEGVEVTGIYAPRKLDVLFTHRLRAGGLPPMHVLNMHRAVHPLDAADLWKMIRLAKELGPFDLIHGHSSKGGALARLTAQRLGIPSVYTSHAIVTLDPLLSEWKRKFYARVERWLARKTGALIAVSEDEADHISGLGIDSSKVHVVPNGIPQPAFPNRDEVRKRLNLSPSDVVIGFVGRLSAQKAPEVLLEAFASAFSPESPARIVMVGSGPLDAEVKAHVERLGLASRVHLLGDVVATDIMPAFDLFCLSSRYEAMPYVYLEALAAGLPIVSTNVGGATMCVDPGENGVIVPAENTAALAEALSTIVNNADVRARYAAASRRMAALFTDKKMVAETLSIYDRVLAAANPKKSATSRPSLKTAASV